MAPSRAAAPLTRFGEWDVDVRFSGAGALLATAYGILPVLKPDYAADLATHSAGDDLFRVVERTPLQSCQCGGDRVEVISRAPVRVLAWKIWTTSRVEVTKCNFGCSMNRCAADGHNKPSRSGKHGIISTRVITFELRSSNVLHSLRGSWTLHHVRLPVDQLCQHWHAASIVSGRRISAGAGASCPMLHELAVNSTDSGFIDATLVEYQQLARPKGLPPGIRFVPGISDAVRASIGREVRQMLEKLEHTAAVGLLNGMSPANALTAVCGQVSAAGGSFKQLQQQLAKGSVTVSAALEKPRGQHARLTVEPLQLSHDGDVTAYVHA